MKKNSGFTLLEVIIYIPLFAILVGSGVFAAYNIIESSLKNQAMFVVYDEGNYLLSKINWAVQGSTEIITPVAGTPGSILKVTKTDGSNISIKLVGKDIVISYGNSDPIILNNSNITISNLSFDNQVSSISQLVKSSMTITVLTDDGKTFSQDFSSTKYLRR